jgi:hypothetical protein
MSIVNEVLAEITAKKLETMIIDSIKNWSSGCPKRFARFHLLQWYLDEIKDTRGIMRPHIDILITFDVDEEGDDQDRNSRQRKKLRAKYIKWEKEKESK